MYQLQILIVCSLKRSKKLTSQNTLFYCLIKYEKAPFQRTLVYE